MPNEISLAGSLRSRLLEQAVQIWRRKGLVLAVAWTVCVVGWAVAMVMPQRYKSDARAYVDLNGILAPVLKGLLIDTNGQPSASLEKAMLNRPNLYAAALRAHLISPTAGSTARQELLTNLQSAIKLTPQGKSIFSLSYTASDPVAARDFLNALLNVFAEREIKSANGALGKAQSFLARQIATYEIELRAAEQRRADFKQKYAVYFDDEGVKKPDAMRTAAARAQQDYEEAVARTKALAGQLSKTSFGLAGRIGANGAVISTSPEAGLAAAQRRLAELKLRYTDKHPDVLLAEQTVSELEAEIASNGKASTEGDLSQATNPVYQQLRLKLADEQAQLPVLKARWDKALSGYNSLVALGATLPVVAAKSQDLDRDYEIIKKNYDELAQRREAANLSEAASAGTTGSQFRVLDPPQIPVYPEFPDRLVLFSFVLVLGVVAGAMASIFWGQFRSTFASPAQLRGLGFPVIGTITNVGSVQAPPILGYDSRRFYAAAIAGLLLLYGGLIVSVTGLTRGVL